MNPQDLPSDWEAQVDRAYEVFGSRHITEAMRAGWRKQRRRGKGRGGGQFMPNIVAQIPKKEPVAELEPQQGEGRASLGGTVPTVIV